MDRMIKEQILDALRKLHIPGNEDNIVALGKVSDICVLQSKVYLSIQVSREEAEGLGSFRVEAEQIVKEIPSVKEAVVTLTSNKEIPRRKSIPKNNISEIKSFIAVASCKGGVGKSTTTVNLACSLKNQGKNIAILDADIYGPSIPTLLKISGKAEVIENNCLKPMENYGIKVMSIGSIVNNSDAMIWRGPMVQSAIMHMLKNVSWGKLDVLLIDMPPGTGDAHLTIAQKIPLSGVIIVSTPQNLAMVDVKRAISMFQKLNIPIIGMIENMSYFIDHENGKKYDIFGNGGVRAEADKMGIPFLESIPLDMDMRIASDIGFPTVIKDPKSIISGIYQKISDRIQQFLCEQKVKN
ncbi:MAG: sodium:proton antiporter [Candidatus Liberibacter europaeus]|uniref:Iron-sulfur cluster carrier protein n=1 Tax=Candidatus Liberibacter europaeus TaxID=744859 RepID=A0A2T4VYB9_9HYPH|nr:MAG: sodium:proton antiporter [Candidatus Liberibacter europaeus]